MQKSDYIGINIIYFFSLDKDDQKLLVGKTREQWFIEEDSSNAGANYLCGLCAVCLEYVNGPIFENEHICEFRNRILKLSNNLDPEFWTFEILSESREWEEVRRLAQICINELNPILHSLRKPFIIEDLIHVDHYTHASVVRKMLNKGKR